jgi:hypothetical protein
MTAKLWIKQLEAMFDDLAVNKTNISNINKSNVIYIGFI